MRNIICSCTLTMLAFISISCEKNDPVSPPPFHRPPSFAGEWSDPGLPLNISVTETDGEIFGYGMLFNVYSLTVRGKNNFPTLTFEIGTPGYKPALFTGTAVTLDSIVGSIYGSGFAANTSSLKRIK